MITLSISISTSSERYVRLYLSTLYVLLAVLFLSSAFTAFWVGGMVSTILYTSVVPTQPQPQREFFELQQCSEQDKHDVLDVDASPKMKTSSSLSVGKKMINYEAMVHPSMITHSSPTKVAIVGYDYDPQNADIISNVLREVMKHTSVHEVVILRNEEEEVGQECSSHGPLFDVIIDPTSVEVVSKEYFASLYTCLKDDGVLALNSKETVKHEDPELGVGKMGVLGGVMEALEGVGYKSLHLYEDEIRGFESRSFIVALKAYASRADWYINEAELEIRLHERISRAATMKFFDVQSMLKYQLPSKAAELVYCRSGNKDREDKCKSRGFDTDFVPLSSVTVGKSTMGEYSGRGLFATEDIPKGRAIGADTNWYSYFILPSSHDIMYELYYWAEENKEEDFALKVWESISDVTDFSEGYGFWSSKLGRTHSTVDAGIMMFCNHGCNGTFNYGRIGNMTEVNADPKQPPPELLYDIAGFNPVLERNMRQLLTTGAGDKTTKDIKKGEEILCNYLEFVGNSSDWEEEINNLRGQCDGSKMGVITEVETELGSGK